MHLGPDIAGRTARCAKLQLGGQSRNAVGARRMYISADREFSGQAPLPGLWRPAVSTLDMC